MEETKRPIVIVGGGFGGLRVARILSRWRKRLPDHPALLIDKHAHHVYTPLLYEVASGCTTDAAMGPTLVHGTSFRFSEVMTACCDVGWIQGEVVACDAAAKTVTLKTGTVVPYAALVLAVGSETDFFGIPGLKERAMTLKTRQDALDLRNRIGGYLKRKKEGREVELDLFVGGGGATGVEFSAEIAGCFRQMERRGELSRSDWAITLVEASPRLLGMLTPGLSARAKARLEELGVKVHLDTCIKRVENGHVVLAPRPLREGETTASLVCEFRSDFEKKFDADLIIWTGGVRGNAMLSSLGIPLDRKGKIAVGGDMRVPGAADVFAIGDCAAVTNPVTKAASPMLAQAALAHADVAASQILADLGLPVARRSYAFPSYPTVIPLGGKSAMAVLGKVAFSGFAGWLVRQAADLRYYLSVLPPRQALATFFHGAWMYTRND